ncbi:ribosomal protein S18 acetylase RimI-like enzyme [Kitasatospora sp. MAA4]|uniref:GNAT family N-acetyltransferase n=1 Tax=Kitasatospora sp. MAA4 TaxID=3035093 RepID=UPI0024768FF3|nr:GNAT family N-acetyltransferase [Kitasatospora sp. MAA4]MDH6131117.1 ribosomal protein S18 acetylase RimI-like enzyme [Kitasatospora sp. MAA4]
MTTTLRPAGPETSRPDGGRDRRWQVCANGRPVGTVRTGSHPLGPGWIGQIADLEIIAPQRRRGRGTFAMLAAEEVLRGWGCGRLELSVPADASAALALAGSLGYTETNRKLAKELGQPPACAPDLTLRRIGEAEFPRWLEHIRATYREHLVRSGLTPQQAYDKCEADHTELLAQGAATPGVALRQLLSGGGPVGSLWVDLKIGERPDGRPLAWVMTVDVDADRRGHGYGRELMLAAERECLAAGVRDLGLNVYSANTVAITLYESLGYRITSRILAKRL